MLDKCIIIITTFASILWREVVTIYRTKQTKDTNYLSWNASRASAQGSYAKNHQGFLRCPVPSLTGLERIQTIMQGPRKTHMQIYNSLWLQHKRQNIWHKQTEYVTHNNYCGFCPNGSLRGGTGRKIILLIFQPYHFIIYIFITIRVKNYAETKKFKRFGNGGHLGFYNLIKVNVTLECEKWVEKRANKSTSTSP